MTRNEVLWASREPVQAHAASVPPACASLRGALRCTAAAAKSSVVGLAGGGGGPAATAGDGWAALTGVLCLRMQGDDASPTGSPVSDPLALAAAASATDCGQRHKT
eukprot:CAMPEP_0115362472 /NCGR_PEP_ID=MMETSP0270-20121206/102723_1 /TAXON_ID=71861 /ORGANISM="Scrippsiella trochoidea, Strain CCMP3099" /LENGTH=105 /DNA_ID=CAMNT_0002785045 /DNA_START=183 /DNA_END=500 /DNA_ORIENTATION=+